MSYSSGHDPNAPVAPVAGYAYPVQQPYYGGVPPMQYSEQSAPQQSSYAQPYAAQHAPADAPVAPNQGYYASSPGVDKYGDLESQGAASSQAYGIRVYSILLCQLTLTTLMVVLFLYNDKVRTYVQRSPWTLIFAFVMSLVLLFVLFWKKDEHPTNLILLTAWTAAMSYTVAVSASYYNAVAVLQAMILTASVTAVLTAYVHYSKKDFSFLGGGLFVMLWVLVLGGFIQLFFPLQSNWMVFVWSSIGAIVFSLYIVYDTSNLIHVYTEDQYIPAAISLYLDIINLFLYLLRIIDALRR